MNRITKVIIFFVLASCVCFALAIPSVKAELYQSFEELENVVNDISENPEKFFTTPFELIEFNEDHSIISVTLKCNEGKMLVLFDQNFNVVSKTRYANTSSELNSDWVIIIFFLAAFVFIIILIEMRRKSPYEKL